jgi:CRP-like cAMP-binding protein
MTADRAALTVMDHLRASFGTFLRIRPPERRRRAAGPTWCVPVVAVCSEGEIFIAEVEVDEAGAMSPVLGPDHVIGALRAPTELPEYDVNVEGFDEAEALFSEIAAEAGEGEADVEASSLRLRDLFRRTDPESLREARKLLPHLLGNTAHRGRVLVMMAEVERRLGEIRLALGYVDAAAHELADRVDMPALEKAAAMAFSLAAEQGLADSPVRGVLDRCRARLEPLQSMFDSPVLTLVPPEHRPLVEAHTRLVALEPGDVLVTEGDPSTHLFVIKSGVLAVLHEEPTSRLVRCCSPGWLLGESSVLAEHDPRCTATLRAEHATEVFRIDAEIIRELMRREPALGARIAETKALHGLDSFFSAHASVGQLDSEVRREMLTCIQSIQTFDERTIVLAAGAVPAAPCLVARGRVSVHEGSNTDAPPVALLGVDQFVGVRDALHRIATPRTAVAEAGSTVVFFDADELRSLADRSPEQIVAVLERLG